MLMCAEMNEQRPDNSAEQYLAVRVIAFSREECPFDKTREHTWQEWHSFRNHVLDILSRYGSVGQMGKMPILDTYEESNDAWESTSKRPDFFVVDDDMYGNSVRVEGDCTLVKPHASPRTANASCAVAGLVRVHGPNQRWPVGIPRPNLV